MSTTTVKRSPKDYKSDLKPIWCPGCGDFGVLASLFRAFAELELDPARTVIVSGIGCSSRLPGFVSTYGVHSLHGRPLPFAMGVKLANPELTVIAVGGDGDGFAIGAGHFPHAARRNVDILYLVMDNETYGLTKGQVSPTSLFERRIASATSVMLSLKAISWFGSIETWYCFTWPPMLATSATPGTDWSA